jgi:hypothetical protein
VEAVKPRPVRMTAGEDGPTIGRWWLITEPDLAKYLQRAYSGETPDDLLLEMLLHSTSELIEGDEDV